LAEGPAPELRIDPLSGLRTIVAGERAERPGAWALPENGGAGEVDPESDPFVEGHEDRTPPEIYAVRDEGPANSPGWRVRVVPNLYPALAPGDGEPPADPLASGRGDPQLFASRTALGAHEVIVHTPRPVASLAVLEPDELRDAMEVWRERMRAHADAACRHLIVNEGRAAGASLPHTHAQFYALPFVPSQIARERERFTAHWERTQGRNLLEDLLQEEVRRKERIVAIGSDAVALCPFAARVPFQVMLVPRTPRRLFEDDGPLGSELLLDVLQRLERALGGPPPFNLWVRTAPSGAEQFCWRIDLLPRLAQPAGLEIGTGVNLNVLPPERAAELLRDV
jgi:UDPglucose--hexose-1-phosphate uridylyltransferase